MGISSQLMTSAVAGFVDRVVEMWYVSPMARAAGNAPQPDIMHKDELDPGDRP
jgi:hypothetical protein